jgi:hypothetical protein
MDECTGDNPRVRVTFTPADGFSFSCCEVRVRPSHDIYFVRKDAKSDWRFVRANDLPDGFTSDTEDDGRVLIVSTAQKPAFKFYFRITVKLNGQDYISEKECDGRTHPPMIMNL